MNRKLQQSGALYFVSTPTEWVNDNKLKKGDELDLQIDENKLVINPNKEVKNYKKTSKDITKATPKALKTVITSFFVAGFDEFELNFKEELSNQAFTELRKLINELGLNMINISKSKVKVNINTEVSDVKKFAKDFIYQVINFTRMLLTGEKDYVSDQLIHLGYQRYVLLRTIYRFQQSLNNLNIKSCETCAYHVLANELDRLAIHLSYLTDKVFITEISKVLEKLLNVFDSSSIESLIELNSIVESLNITESKNVKNNKDYRVRRVYRALKDLIRSFTEARMTSF